MLSTSLHQMINGIDNVDETALLIATTTGKLEMDIWINAKKNLAMDMAIEANLKKKELSVKEMVPSEYHKYLDVFDEEKVNRFPESKEWDHKIDMKEGFEPKFFKN